MNWIKHDYGSKAGTWTASLGILDFVVFPEDRGYRYRIVGATSSTSTLFMMPQTAMRACEASVRYWMNMCLKELRPQNDQNRKQENL